MSSCTTIVRSTSQPELAGTQELDDFVGAIGRMSLLTAAAHSD